MITVRIIAILILFFSATVSVGASVRLDTSRVMSPDIASALRQAYQLPTLIGGGAADGASEMVSAAVERERTRLQRLLVDLGYLDAEILVTHTDAAIVLRPVLGQRYRVTAVELRGVRQSELERKVVDDLAVIISDFVGQPATARIAGQFGRRIVQTVGARDFALAGLGSVGWSRSDGAGVTAVVELDMGLPMRFGSVVFSGLQRLQEEDLHRLVPFRPGDRYEQAQIEVLRDRLEALNAVNRVNISIEAGEGGVLAVDTRLREAPADLSALRKAGPFGLASGIAALAGLALARIAAAAGAPRLRPLARVNIACVLTFAALAAERLVSFLA